VPDRFVYVTYIRATPEKVWNALLDAEFNKQYWFGAHMESEWKKGAAWKIVLGDGRIADTGEIVEIDKPKKIVIKWRNEFMPELKAEGWSQCTIELEQVADTVKLSILHEIGKDDSKFIQAVSGGWPKIMSGLKSLLETGKSLGDFKTEAK
jgi:uncharacterized protein YndB with AHSA1/START domain